MEFEQIGKYKILGEIGQGAMGVVYKAHDPILNRHVAIKTISATLGTDDDLRKRFHREAQAAARLNHPNIITVFDFGEEHGKIYMAMELLEGTDLKDVMSGGQLATLDDKLAIMEQILDGLAFAHAKEIVHRDLKPGNIHIQPNGQIKIMDFGLARLGSSEMTQAGVVMGTPNYMSPEQVLGEKVDSRSDIFAMGAVFYELLTTHKPFEAESMHGVLFQVVHKDPQAIRKWAPDLPPVLVQVVEKCLVKDKTKRFQNAGELREAVMEARQALLHGRISEATLDMESGKVFFDADQMVDDEDGTDPGSQRPSSWPPQKRDGQWVEGTVALDQAPLEGVLEEEPSPQSKQPTLSGKSRTQVNRSRTQRGLPPPEPPSRMPLLIGAAVVALAAAGGAWYYLSRPKELTAVVQLLIETRNELAQSALEDKDYKKAIDTVESTVSMAKAEGAADTHRLVVQSRKILDEARTKFGAIETTANDAETAFNAGNIEPAAAKLNQLLELDPNHPVAKSLSPKLNEQFQQKATESRSAMQQARDQTAKVTGSVPAEFRSEGRTDLGKAETAVTGAEAALKSKEYAQATRQFLEARDAFERSRRAIETKMAEAAKKDAEIAKQLKVPAEEAKTSMTRVRGQAEQASAGTKPLSRDEFNAALALAKQAETALQKNEYPDAKRLFDQARGSFERARMIATTPVTTTTLVTATTTTTMPITTTTMPITTTTLAPLPVIGRLEPDGVTQSGKDKIFDVPTQFKGSIDFEPVSGTVRAGDAYAIKVYVTNTGDRAARLREVSINTRLNATGTPQRVPPQARSVDPGQKVQVAEVAGTWPEAIRSWTTTVTVTGDDKEFLESKITFRRQ